MAKFSTKSVLIALTLTGAMLPAAAMAGPSATQANAPVEMWDVVAPRAKAQPVISYLDVQPSTGFDARGTVIPHTVQIVTRDQFQGSVAATEMWDAVPAPSARKEKGPSYMDIQPGDSFDYPAARTRKAPVQYVYARTATPDA